MKVTNLLDHAKENDEVLPVEIDQIIQRLQQVPKDIADEYVSVLNEKVDEMLLWRNIASSIGTPRICRHLIEQLSPEYLERLRCIAISLASHDPISKIGELSEATFSCTVPTPETFEKSKNLIDDLKTLDVDFKKKSEKFAELSGHARTLSNIFCVLNIGLEFGDLMIDRLSRMHETDLDRLIEIGNTIVVNNQ